MRIDYITLFPEMMLQAVAHSMLKRASDKGLVEYHAMNPRDFTTDNHRTVDDKPFGGGPGMLMMAEPIARALESLHVPPLATNAKRALEELSSSPAGGESIPIRNPQSEIRNTQVPPLVSAAKAPESLAVILPDPTGRTFTQEDAIELSTKQSIVFICGHYEGIDERIKERYVTHSFSIGDYVLTGGELPALVITDAIVRTIKGVLGDIDSLTIDSHSDGLLSAPQYTRPETWEGLDVPEVLRSGDHKAVERWKRQQALKITRDNRPDLFAKTNLDKKDLDLLSS